MSNRNDHAGGDQADSVLAELSDLDAQSLSSNTSGNVARVKKRPQGKVKQQHWVSDGSADGLLAGLLGEAEAEAEAEKARIKAELKAREEAEARKKQELESRKRAEAAAQLAKEQQRIQEQNVRRTQMVAAIERQKKIESGELDEERERREKEEAAARKLAEEQERLRKEQELNASRSLIEQQQRRLEELANRPVEAPVIEQRSNTGLVAALAALVVLAIGGAVAFVMLSGPAEAVADPLAIDSSIAVPAAQGALKMPGSAMADVGLDVVSQKEGMAVTQIAASTTDADAAGTKPGRTSSGRTSRPKKDPKADPKKDQFKDLGGSDVLGGRGGGILVK